MTEKIKAGDYLRVCSDDTHSDLTPYKGKVLVAFKDESSDGVNEANVITVTLEGNTVGTNSTGYKVSRFEKLTEKEAKAIKDKPIEKFIIFKESCMNYIGMANSLDEASRNYKPSPGDTYLICKAVVVAKVALKYDITKVE
jgi:hypothetical protein